MFSIIKSIDQNEKIMIFVNGFKKFKSKTLLKNSKRGKKYKN
jgi:hypothetical protein